MKSIDFIRKNGENQMRKNANLRKRLEEKRKTLEVENSNKFIETDINEELKSKIKKQYHLIFDKDGNITEVGQQSREKKALIFYCELFDKCRRDYGEMQTGVMNIENIQILAKEIGVI